MNEFINFREMYTHYKKRVPLKERVTYKQYAEILREFHKQISEEIINGYRFDIPDVGIFRILCCDRTKKSKGFKDVNWFASNQRRQQLLDEGRTPKDKDHPDGEDWFIYHTDPYYFQWKWFKGRRVMHSKNMNYYYFKPTFHNKRALSAAVKANPLMEIGNDLYS